MVDAIRCAGKGTTMIAELLRYIIGGMIGWALGSLLLLPLFVPVFLWAVRRFFGLEVRPFFSFLVPRLPSFLDGAAEIFAFGHAVQTYNVDQAADIAALQLDAQAIAFDMQVAAASVGREVAYLAAQEAVRRAPLRPVGVER